LIAVHILNKSSHKLEPEDGLEVNTSAVVETIELNSSTRTLAVLFAIFFQDASENVAKVNRGNDRADPIETTAEATDR
jgi:hypothetical protein